MTSPEAKIRFVEFRPDDTFRHVTVTDPGLCRDCKNKECLAICPAAVFRWDHIPGHPLTVLYRQCVECGACRLACPAGNIAFIYPRGGYGVIFHQG